MGLKSQSRPTEYDGEKVSAVGIKRSQIPGTYWASLCGGGRSKAVFLCTDFLAYCLQNFPWVN